jgi:serine/threonine protein kinase
MIILHVFQPERIRGEEYSNPAEVWSFGITLFEVAFLSNL